MISNSFWQLLFVEDWVKQKRIKWTCVFLFKNLKIMFGILTMSVWIFLVYLICFDCCFSNMRLTTRKLWTWKMKSEFWNIQHITNKSLSNGFHHFEKKWNSFYEQLRVSFKFIYFNSNFSQKVFKNAYTPLGVWLSNEGLFSFKSAVSSWPDLIKSQFPSRSGLVLNPRFSSRSGLVLNPSFPRDLIYQMPQNSC